MKAQLFWLNAGDNQHYFSRDLNRESWKNFSKILRSGGYTGTFIEVGGKHYAHIHKSCYRGYTVAVGCYADIVKRYPYREWYLAEKRQGNLDEMSRIVLQAREEYAYRRDVRAGILPADKSWLEW